MIIILIANIFKELIAAILISIPSSIFLWIVYVGPFVMMVEIGEDIEKTTFPNQSIWKTLMNSCIVFLLITMTFAMLSGIIGWQTTKLSDGFINGIKMGLLAGAMFGLFVSLVPGLSCIQHFSLRAILYFINKIPWDYARFLDNATENLFLQKVGGGYIFVHRMLMEHFAQMKES